MSKMGSHNPFGYLNISYGQKKGQESNCQFDPRPLKVRNNLDFLSCKWHVTYCWIFFNEGYNFALDITSIGGLHRKLWDSKVTRVSILGISRLPFWSPRTKWHLGAGPMARHKEYYKGEGGGFLEVQPIVSLVSRCLPMARLCTNRVPTMH